MRAFIVLTIGTLLIGCSPGGHSDLEAYTTQVQQEAAPNVKPLPEIPELERVAYTGDAVRNPFKATPLQARDDDAAGTNCPQPNLQRMRGPLESLALDQLTFSGTLKAQDGNYAAIIISNQGRLYRVEQGQYIGLNRGQVIAINPQQLSIREWLPTGDGCWQRRDATLRLPNSQRSSDS